MAVIDNRPIAGIAEEEQTDQMSHPDPKDMTVDVNWMYEYGKHLFAKYVKSSADLAINTDYTIRRNLWSIYSRKTNEEAFQKILLHYHDVLVAITSITEKEEQLVLQTYLYHAFDLAFHSVWTMLKKDTFFRFQQTKEYKVLCDQKDAQKLEEEKAQREREYSKSDKHYSHLENVEEEEKKD